MSIITPPLKINQLVFVCVSIASRSENHHGVHGDAEKNDRIIFMEYASLPESEMCHCRSTYMCKKKMKKKAHAIPDQRHSRDLIELLVIEPSRNYFRNRRKFHRSFLVSSSLYIYVFFFFHIGEEEFCSRYLNSVSVTWRCDHLITAWLDCEQTITARPSLILLSFFLLSHHRRTRKRQMKRIEHKRWIWLSLPSPSLFPIDR